MPPSVIVVDIRGQTQASGPARIGTLDGGKIFTQIGADIASAGTDPSRLADSAPHQLCVRMRGTLVAYLAGVGAALVSLFVYDEHGSNAWGTGAATKGGTGFASIAGVGNTARFGPLLFVQTATKDFLVGFAFQTSNDIHVARYDPSLGSNGTWSGFITPETFGGGGMPHAFVHDAIVHFAVSGGVDVDSYQTFNPATGALVNLGHPVTGYTFTHARHFTLYGRLFVTHVRNTATNPWVTEIWEFVLGAWVVVAGGTTTNHGSNGGGSDLCVVTLSPTKVLMFGAGGGNGANGLVCTLFETVGDSPTGNLVATDVTNPVIPAALRPTSAVGDPDEYRVGCVVDTESVPGAATPFLYFMNDGVGVASSATLFQIVDELTEMLDLGIAQSDSDFAHPRTFYGGGHVLNGIDGSTRLVTVSPRGYVKGLGGLTVKCSAHGDPVVLAHGGVTSGPFTDGKVLTGGSSGATGLFVGDGAAEGVFLHEATGTFTPGETVTGAGSGASIVLDHVLQHGSVTGGPFQVAETVTGGTSGATGVVTHLGIGGAGEQLVKVDTVAGGPCQSGETITGGTSSATAVLSAGPSGQHGGLADKTIRARFFLSGAVGKGTPITGPATMVLGSGNKGTVSKGTGPSGEDELINVVADGTFGTKDSDPPSFEWDFLADSVAAFNVTSFAFEIDR